MERLGDVLKSLGVDGITKHRTSLTDLVHLPPSEELRAIADQVQARYQAMLTANAAPIDYLGDGPLVNRYGSRDIKHAQEAIDIAQHRLELGAERDALQKERPDGCWCLGMGGKEPRALPYSKTREGRIVEGPIIYNITCMCPEGLAEQARKGALLKEIEAAEEAERRERIWRNANFPSRFRDMSLYTSPLARTHPDLIARLLWDPAPLDSPDGSPEWDEWSSKMNAWEGSWFFHGAYGVGKTGLAVGLAREWLNHWDTNSIVFRTVPKLLSELRDTYNRTKGEETPSEADLIGWFTSCSVLVLDDLGAEQVRDTGWVADRLYQIIGERHDENRVTIFTSNLSLDALSAKLGERIVWRIAEMCGKEHVIHVEGSNLRV